MENPVLLHSFRRTQGARLNTSVSLDPEQEQRDDSEPDTQPESNQGTPEPRSGPPHMALIAFRIQQLHNRRFVLLKMQHFSKKAEDNSGGTTEEMTSEDSDELSELEAIQKELEELEELLVKKEELEEQGKRSNLSNGQRDARPTFSPPPRGGVYMLPPPELTQEEDITLDITPKQRVKPRPEPERPTGPVVPVGSLGLASAFTQCPSCKEVVLTETQSKVGETMWILCCLCSMLGCVAGCCAIPFFLDSLRTIFHQCPQCRAHIHTHRPL